MSYILDALKKSEQKRRRGTSPDLLTPHGALPHEAKRRAFWPYLLFFALLLNIGLFLWWQGPRREVKPVSLPDRGQVLNLDTSQKNVKPEMPGSAANVKIQDLTPPAKKETPPPPVKKTCRLSELPPSVQQALPQISISAHFYDENPASRIVSINGKLMHEGQMAADGIKLEKITRDGVVLGYQGYRFTMGIF